MACHDLSNPDIQQHVLSEGHNAVQMLSEINNTYPNNEVEILIFVAQSNKFGLSEKEDILSYLKLICRKVSFNLLASMILKVADLIRLIVAKNIFKIVICR